MYRKLDEAALGAILEAGIAEFARCGFQPASIAAVAKSAGVSVGVIYKYFGDKDAFFLTCVRHSLELLDATLQEAAAGGGSLEARMRRLILALIRQLPEVCRSACPRDRIAHSGALYAPV